MLSPTPHTDINKLLHLLLTQVRATLGEKLVGLYLYGSLAGGDFDREGSDIDFVVVTSEEVDEEEFARLKAMHDELIASGGPWGKKLEGAYIPLAALRRYDPAYKQPFLSSDTPFTRTALGIDWVINRHTLREKGVVVYGPPPSGLIDPIPHEELIATVRDLLTRDWASYVDGPEWMHPRAYQGFVVLTMCRALYALERGELVSKRVASAWAEEHLDPEWVPLIERAHVWRRANDQTVDYTTLPDTLRFLCYAIERGRLT